MSLKKVAIVTTASQGIGAGGSSELYQLGRSNYYYIDEFLKPL